MNEILHFYETTPRDFFPPVLFVLENTTLRKFLQNKNCSYTEQLTTVCQDPIVVMNENGGKILWDCPCSCDAVSLKGMQSVTVN